MSGNSEWQPIETAPKDGTRILLANGVFFAAGERAFYTEPELTSDLAEWHRLLDEWRRDYHEVDPTYSGGLFTRPRTDIVVPRQPDIPMVRNPKAGETREWWHTDNPSAFRERDETYCDHDGQFDEWKPTHWMPLPDPPSSHASLERTGDEGKG